MFQNLTTTGKDATSNITPLTLGSGDSALDICAVSEIDLPPPAFQSNLNPLVGAASELLSKLVWVQQRKKKVKKLARLKKRLRQHIVVFEHWASLAKVERSEVLTARYLLCTVIDEAILTKSWGSDWASDSLLSQFHQDTSGGEKFFQHLERVMKQPALHLDMAELMYLCLALGFQGKYAMHANGPLELEKILNELYRQIREQRGEVPRELSPQWQGQPCEPQPPIRIVPWWLVALFTLVSLGVMYTGFAWVLAVEREAVLKPYQSLSGEAVERSR
jgi:type VI secretion system protein ImpK